MKSKLPLTAIFFFSALATGFATNFNTVGNISTTDGSPTYGVGNISAAGYLYTPTSVFASKYYSTASAGYVITGGYVSAATTITAGGNISSTSGNVSAGGTVIAPVANFRSSTLGILTSGGTGSSVAGTFGTAMGYAATAGSYSSVVIGRYNIQAASGASDGSAVTAGSWVDKDPLFVVGNGNGTVSDPNQYRNAFTIYKDGTIACGSQAKAASNQSFVIGRNNLTIAKDGTASTPGSWVDKDPLFVVGNGNGTVSDPNQYRNALAVFKDGTVRIAKRQGDIKMGAFGTPGSND